MRKDTQELIHSAQQLGTYIKNLLLIKIKIVKNLEKIKNGKFNLT